jgi:hypothetical protein
MRGKKEKAQRNAAVNWTSLGSVECGNEALAFHNIPLRIEAQYTGNIARPSFRIAVKGLSKVKANSILETAHEKAPFGAEENGHTFAVTTFPFRAADPEAIMQQLQVDAMELAKHDIRLPPESLGAVSAMFARRLKRDNTDLNRAGDPLREALHGNGDRTSRNDDGRY